VVEAPAAFGSFFGTVLELLFWSVAEGAVVEELELEVALVPWSLCGRAELGLALFFFGFAETPTPVEAPVAFACAPI